MSTRSVSKLAGRTADKARIDCKEGLINATVTSGYAMGSCDVILKAIDGKPSSAICNIYWTCVKDWIETNPPGAVLRVASDLKTSALADCDALIDNNDKSSGIWGRYDSGYCDNSLGGWLKTCNEYHSCHYDPREMQCEFCSMFIDGDGCDNTRSCNDHCMSDGLFKLVCEEECNPQ